MKPVFLTYILIGIFLFTGCSNTSSSNVSVKSISWSGNITASGHTVVVSGSWKSTVTKTTIPKVPEPKKCVVVFEDSVSNKNGTENILRRAEISLKKDCGIPKRKNIIKDSSILLNNWEEVIVGDQQLKEYYDIWSNIFDVNDESMGQNNIKVLKKEKIRKNDDGKEGIIAAREIWEEWKVKGFNVTISPQTFIEAWQYSFFITAMVSEKKWKSTYAEMKEILQSGFKELPEEKIEFDWSSVKTSSAKFTSDAIQISDKNGAQKSIPVKVTSSKDLSEICNECRNNLAEICKFLDGSCIVDSVSGQEIRWEQSLKTTDEYETEYFKTDIATGNTKLLKYDSLSRPTRN